MQKKLLLLIFLTTALFSGCNSQIGTQKEDTFVVDVIKDIEESDYVEARCDELGLDKVSAEISHLYQREAKHASFVCEIIYSDDYGYVSEMVICSAYTDDDGEWDVEEIEMLRKSTYLPKDIKYIEIEEQDSLNYKEYTRYTGIVTPVECFEIKDYSGTSYYSGIKMTHNYGLDFAETTWVEYELNSEYNFVYGEYLIPTTSSETDKYIFEIYLDDVLVYTSKEMNSQNSISFLYNVTGCNTIKLASRHTNVYTNKDNKLAEVVIADVKLIKGQMVNVSNDDEKYDENVNNENIGNDENIEKTGLVYYLNFKPEQDLAWLELASKYTAETGIEVKVVTAAPGNYESLLQSEMLKEDVPTLFQVNGPKGLAEWQDYCYDLTDSKVTKELTSDSYTLKSMGKTYGVGYVIESYGIIVNKTLLKEAGFDVSDINSFEDLKTVAESITRRSDKLGFAAFTSAGMDWSSDWRFKTHLANIPIYFEYQADGINTTDAIKGTYLDNYRDIFDLYINNSTCDGESLANKSGDDARNEFINEEAVFWQNGTWEYGNLCYDFSDDELAMIPIYIGAGNEAKQGLCTGTENYWCVNRYASKEDIQATLDFMYWCVTSETGTEAMRNEMGFCIPFKQAAVSNNLFEKQDALYTAEGKVPVTWNFTTMPSEAWKNGVGYALTTYAANQTDANWDKVVEAFVDGWKTESYYSQGIGEI